MGVPAPDPTSLLASLKKRKNDITSFRGVGKLTFTVTREIQKRTFARQALLDITAKEQNGNGRAKDMSQVLWDMFTGSAPYQEIFIRALHPRFLTRFTWELARSLTHSMGVRRARET